MFVINTQTHTTCACTLDVYSHKNRTIFLSFIDAKYVRMSTRLYLLYYGKMTCTHTRDIYTRNWENCWKFDKKYVYLTHGLRCLLAAICIVAQAQMCEQANKQARVRKFERKYWKDWTYHEENTIVYDSTGELTQHFWSMFLLAAHINEWMHA